LDEKFNDLLPQSDVGENLKLFEPTSETMNIINAQEIQNF
jgi:hypothetical protein